jgi:Transcription elongation factor, GreA/GreB, C-term
VVSIVGTDEIDLNRNHISWVSPLGRALMKSAADDSVVLQLPGGTEHLTVLDVCYERVSVEPFREPPGSEASAKRLPRRRLIHLTKRDETEKPDATNVAGLRTWNSLGRFIKRGEKGIFILAPMVGRRSTKDTATDEPSEDATTEGQRTLYGFRAVYVFDRLSRDLWPSLCALDRSRQCHVRKSSR